MRTLGFPCWASSGKLDYVDWTWDFEVSDEEFERLKKAAETEKPFNECSDVADIYERIYAEMISQQADVYLDEDDLLEEVMEELELTEDDEVSKEQVIDYLEESYLFGLHFPNELCKTPQEPPVMFF